MRIIGDEKLIITCSSGSTFADPNEVNFFFKELK